MDTYIALRFLDSFYVMTGLVANAVIVFAAIGFVSAVSWFWRSFGIHPVDDVEHGNDHDTWPRTEG